MAVALLAISLFFIVCSGNGCGIVDPPDPKYLTDWEALPAWSNAGDRIAFASVGLGDTLRLIGLYVVDTNGNNLQVLASGGRQAAWLHGDTAIVFHKVDFKLYYLNLGTMEESLLCDCGFTSEGRMNWRFIMRIVVYLTIGLPRFTG